LGQHKYRSGSRWHSPCWPSSEPWAGRLLRAAEYLPPHEPPDDKHPFVLITGRTVFHFHTRTKTGRTPELQAAAPEVWVECSQDDARRLGLTHGDLAEVTTPRGAVRARVRITGIRDGVVFLPFHYGYWDTPGGSRPADSGRAANELTARYPASSEPSPRTCDTAANPAYSCWPTCATSIGSPPASPWTGNCSPRARRG
jgi:anaerobic selenocysteine-containing dehydrogenase